MKKFGRPDLSFDNINQDQLGTASYVLNWLIEDQACGLLIEEGQLVELEKVGPLPSPIVCHHAGSNENPDFNNVHIELRLLESN
jgi:hypothetical protein